MDRPWRIGVSRERCRRCEEGEAHFLPTECPAQEKRDCMVFLGCLPIEKRSGSNSVEGHEGSAPRPHDGSEEDALGRETHVLGRIQDGGEPKAALGGVARGESIPGSGGGV